MLGDLCHHRIHSREDSLPTSTSRPASLLPARSLQTHRGPHLDGKHNDPFPVFHGRKPPAGRPGLPRYQQQRHRRAVSRERRVAECIESLNALAAYANGSRVGPMPQPSRQTSQTHQAVCSRVGSRVSEYPCDASARSDPEALLELLKTKDFYNLDPSLREDYDPERLKIMRGNTTPRPLESRLEGEALHHFQNF